jgi:midasin (ATPase involved in ribosome maturation)
MLSKGLSALGAVSYDKAALQGGVEPQSMIRHSPAGARIPFTAALVSEDAAAGSTSSSSDAGLQLQIENAQARLSDFCSSVRQSPLHAAALQQVEQLWQRALARPEVQGQVGRLIEVLEGEVLPNNKHTRRRAEESGPSLHLPGLIRAASSNYSSRKIFARKTAGGKRTYQVALLLDVSQLMQGHLQHCSLEVLAMMADALGKVGLDDFVVMTFGAAPVLVKGPDTAWDQASQLALLEQVNCRTGAQTVATGCNSELVWLMSCECCLQMAWWRNTLLR